KDYKDIWKAFLENEEKTFKKMLGYGKKAIKKIGYKKFIDTMDWRTPQDVSKYKTDVMHVVICPVCKNEFGLYEQNIGLCHKCSQNYDMDRFWATYSAVAKQNMQEADSMIKLFFAFNEFREMYKVRTQEEQIKLMVKAKFSGMDTFRFVMDFISTAELRKLTLNEFLHEFKGMCMPYIYKKEDATNLKFFIEYMERDVNKDEWVKELKEKLYKEIK
ncbi:MAG TPA: hypothetical protein PKK61_10710, partial [Defluviitaleaceae bacterium]|nr:hypothetical protein [Defluviitaleaceae bacterium]